MANTILQIRRSTTAANPGTTLANGELAYSYNSNSLYIGAQAGVGTAGFAIGGVKYGYLNNLSTPGILAANATIVTDANSFVNNVYTTGLLVYVQSNTTLTNSIFLANSTAVSINNVPLFANGGAGSSAQVLTSNGATGSPYWSTVTSGTSGVGSAGSGQVIFADGTAPNGTAGFTFTKTTNNVTIGNTLTIGTSVTNSTSFAVGTIGAASNGTLITQNLIQVGNTSVYSNVAPGAVFTTANVVTPILYGNVVATVVNASANMGVGTIGAASNGTLITTNLIQVGNTTVYSNVIPGAVYTTANVVTPTLYGNVVATVVNASANVGVGTIGVASNGTLITQNLIQVGNTTVYSNVTPGAVYATANVTAPLHYGNVVATVVNASANVGVGTIGAASNGTLITTNLIQVGNTTVYSNVTPGAVYSTSNVVTVNVYATTVNATANVQTATLFGNVVATVVNASANVGVGTIGAASNGTLITNNLIQIGNTTVYSNVIPGAVYTTANVTSPTFYGNVVATVVNASANMGVGTIGAASNGTLITNNLIQIGNTTVYSNVTPGAVYSTSNVVTVNVYATTITATNAVITGNLTVTGTLSTIDTVSLVIKDNLIGLADQNSPNYVSANGYAPQVIADSVDFGLIGSAPVQTQTNYSTSVNFNGTTTVAIGSNTNFYPGQLVTGTFIPANTYITATTSTTLTISNPASGSGAGTINAYYTAFYGMARIQSTNNFTFFVSNTQISSPSTPANNFPFQTTVGAASQTLMPLSFLGVNSTSTGVTIAANSTVNVNITANTLTLASALGAGSGGTGLNTLTAGAVLYGNGTSAVGLAAVGANGTVLQILNNIPAFGGVDGGTF